MSKHKRPTLTGFKQLNLSNEAALLLSAFDQHSELLWPQEAVRGHLTLKQCSAALRELTDKGFVHSKRPYKLTGIGTILKARQKDG